MRIQGWIAGRDGCATLRIMRPLDAIAEQYPDVTIGYDTIIDSDLPYDVVIGQRIALEHPSQWWQAMARMSRRRPRLVLELDDDLFHIDPSNGPAYRAYMNPETHERIAQNIIVADAVTVSTDVLAEVVAPLNANVHVVPNCIPRSLLNREIHREPGKLVIGWGGSPTHSQDMAEIGGQLRLFVKRSRNPGLEVHIIGTDYRKQLGVPEARYTPWSKTPADYWNSIDYDLGLCPLADTVFSRSKSNIKLLEHSALGIPSLCSDVPAYRQSILGGGGGLLVRPGEWAGALRTLANDHDLRAELGRRARQWASGRVMEENVERWYAAFSGVSSPAE